MILPATHAPAVGRRRQGFTLIEVLLATTLTLMLMGAVVTIFGLVSTSVSDSRATLEMTDRLRSAVLRLQRDLGGVTATMLPPRRPSDDEGYFQYTEGPVGPRNRPPETFRINSDLNLAYSDTRSRDSTVGDNDDMLMFTTRSIEEPFVGRWATTSWITSSAAEVAWFIRGRTLYRRVLLVAPRMTSLPTAAGFYAGYDLSVRFNGSQLVANSLGDLTKPENRFAHQNGLGGSSNGPGLFPFHPHRNLTSSATSQSWRLLGLPRLVECCSTKRQWRAGYPLPAYPIGDTQAFDAWAAPYPWTQVDKTTGALSDYYASTDQPTVSSRHTEDVVITNVLAFDVKAWDPGAPVYAQVANSGPTLLPGDIGYNVNISPTDSKVTGYGAYVDLGWQDAVYSSTYVATPPAPEKLFYHRGMPNSRLNHAGSGNANIDGIRVYDTWSTHFEANAVDENGDGVYDTGANGFDDDNDGVVDDLAEQEAPPPYPAPLRGIQVRIRAFDPDSRQIREMTIVQDFLP